MRDGDSSRVARLEIVTSVRGRTVAAVVIESNRWGAAVVGLNRALLTGRRVDDVLSWARRELASGKRVSWLLADELDGLA